MKAADIIRCGAITEIVGRLSSGRTSLLLTGLRETLGRGGVAALVDTDGAFDPDSAHATGVDLRRLLWIRCGGRRDVALRATDLLVRCPGFALVALDVGESPPFVSLATAFRLRLAVRRTSTALVILASRHLVGASASLVVETVAQGPDWTGAGATPRRLAGARSDVWLRRVQGAAPGSPPQRWRWQAS